MVGNAALIRCKINKTIDKQNPFDVFIAPLGKQMIIGRDLTSDFRIDSIEVSRRHAVLETVDNNWFITDLEVIYNLLRLFDYHLNWTECWV